MRLSVLLFALVIGGGSLWYLVGGGRTLVDGLLARLVMRHAPASADEAIEFVRATSGGPANMTVDDRLDVVSQRLGQAGIQLSDIQWDAIKAEKGGWVVGCTLVGNGYQRRLEWDVDADLTAAAPRNSAAHKLDTIDASMGKHGEPWGTPANAPRGQKPEGAAHGDNLVLLGVVSSPTGRLALIRTPPGNVQVTVGQRVKDWTVRDIWQRSNGDSTVVLVRGKEMRVLRMSGRAAAALPSPPKTDQGSGAPTPPPSAGPAPASSAGSTSSPGAPPPPNLGPSGETATVSPPPGPDPPIGTPNVGDPHPGENTPNLGGGAPAPPP